MNLSALRKVPPVQPAKVLDRLEGDIPSDVGDGLSDNPKLGCQVGVLVKGIHDIPEAFATRYKSFDRRTRAGVADKAGEMPVLREELVPHVGSTPVAAKIPSSDFSQRGLERRGERNVPSIFASLRRGLGES